MIRLYLDEDTGSDALLSALRALGIDTISTGETSRLGQPDPDQLAFTTAAQRAIYTANATDFMRLHIASITAGRTHAGIIIASRRRPSIGDQARALARLSDARTPATMQDRLDYLTAWLTPDRG